MIIPEIRRYLHYQFTRGRPIGVLAPVNYVRREAARHPAPIEDRLTRRTIANRERWIEGEAERDRERERVRSLTRVIISELDLTTCADEQLTATRKGSGRSRLCLKHELHHVLMNMVVREL